MRARVELERLVAESPGDIGTRILLARAHLLLGDTDAAQATLNLVLEMSPSHTEARATLEGIQPARG
jgi:cytochrome c-type biogenesis protein CcmH/NrfG